MRALTRRLDALAARRAEEDWFVRVVRVMNPSLDPADQDRWLGAAEVCAEAELRAGEWRSPLGLWCHAEAPGVVAVDAPKVRLLVAVTDGAGGEATATVLERVERRW